MRALRRRKFTKALLTLKVLSEFKRAWTGSPVPGIDRRPWYAHINLNR